MFLGIYIKKINSLSQNISNNLHPARQAYWRDFTLLTRVHTGEKSKIYQKSIHTPKKFSVQFMEKTPIASDFPES